MAAADLIDRLVQTITETLAGLRDGHAKPRAGQGAARGKRRNPIAEYWETLPIQAMIDRRLILTAKIRIRMYRKLSSLVSTGMPLPRALDLLWQMASSSGRNERARLAVIVNDWRKQVYDGVSFGKAMNGTVPDGEWTVIEAGAHNLGSALEDAAQLVEASQKMSGAVVGAAGYPLFLFGLVITLMWIFGTEAIPAFAQIKPTDQWTGLAAGLASMSHFVQVGLIPLLAGLALLLGVTIWSLPRWTGDWRTRFDNYPPWSFYRLIVGSSTLITLIAFIKAGMPVPEALRRIRDNANPWLRERLDAALFYMNNGFNLGEALYKAGHAFPAEEIVEDLRIYASLGSFEESLQLLSKEWLSQSIQNLKAVGDSLRVIGMILVAGAIATIQAGIFSIQAQITTTPM